MLVEKVAGAIVMLALFLGFAWYQRRRAARAFRREAHCVVCDGTDLVLLAPAVYRCKACGHEGGEGRAARAREQRNAALRGMDPAERRESARRDLLEARTLLLSGLGDLEHTQASFADALASNREHVGSPEQGDALASGSRQLLEARAKARDAEAKLGLSFGAAASADLGDRADVLQAALFGVNTPAREGRAMLAEGHAMLEAVEAALASQWPRERGRNA